mmetsp:Transcript_8807/g.19713  ORF Transcript_8807/g.19713 Transcript_8807/m.19713 type:complete len:260 (-) Transcript_8807:84-863(-)
MLPTATLVAILGQFGLPGPEEDSLPVKGAKPGVAEAVFGLPSMGSANHVYDPRAEEAPWLFCTPCKYVFSRQGCRNGVECPRCHFHHRLEPRLRPSKGVRKRLRKLNARMQQRIDELPPWLQAGDPRFQCQPQSEPQPAEAEEEHEEDDEKKVLPAPVGTLGDALPLLQTLPLPCFVTSHSSEDSACSYRVPLDSNPPSPDAAAAAAADPSLNELPHGITSQSTCSFGTSSAVPQSSFAVSGDEKSLDRKSRTFITVRL